jgi:hypothetical protein
MKNLNNLLNFKDYIEFNKLENKPGKIIEGYDYDELLDENIIGDMYDKGKKYYKDTVRKKSLERIMSHPVRRKFYNELLKTDKEKAEKYIDFWKNGDTGIPMWVESEQKFVDKGIYSMRDI